MQSKSICIRGVLVARNSAHQLVRVCVSESSDYFPHLPASAFSSVDMRILHK